MGSWAEVWVEAEVWAAGLRFGWRLRPFGLLG